MILYKQIRLILLAIIILVCSINNVKAQNLSEETKLELMNLYNQSQEFLSKGDYDKAIELKTQVYNKTQNLGDLKIMGGMSAFDIAQIYSTVRNDLKNYIFWLERAEQCDFPGASGRLGDAYLTGQDGVLQNFQKAKYYYEKANEGRCKWILATMYGENGELGRNDTEWLKYTNQAVEKDDPNAQFWLGLYYLDGKIVRKDLNKGLELIKKAAQQNHIKAIRFLEENNIH